MSTKTRILAFAGSTREESLNKKLLKAAVETTREAGGEVTTIDLRDFPLPLYDGDLEAKEGLPKNAKQLRTLFFEHQGLLLACPEYNSSITPLLKNTIDWVSRSETKQGSLEPYQGKTAALCSASPGALGGLRGLVHLRSILGNIGVLVIPQQLAVGKAHEAFQANGKLQDAKLQESLKKFSAELVRVTSLIHTR